MTGLPWSFFLENIVFQKNQTKNQTFHRKHCVSLLPGWGNKTYWYFCKAHIYIYIFFFCMNLLAPHPMFTASFRKKGQIPDLKVILHHILLPRRGILGITTNIQSHVPTNFSKMEARGVGCIEYRTLHSGGRGGARRDICGPPTFFLGTHCKFLLKMSSHRNLEFFITQFITAIFPSQELYVNWSWLSGLQTLDAAGKIIKLNETYLQGEV